MPEGPFSSAENRSTSRRHGRALTDELFRRISGLSSNSSNPRGSRKDFLYNAGGELSLHGDVIWIEECKGYISTDGYTYVQGADRQNSGGLY